MGICYGSQNQLRLGALKLQQTDGQHSKPFDSTSAYETSSGTASGPPVAHGLTHERVPRFGRTARSNPLQTTTLFRRASGPGFADGLVSLEAWSLLAATGSLHGFHAPSPMRTAPGTPLRPGLPAQATDAAVASKRDVSFSSMDCASRRERNSATPCAACRRVWSNGSRLRLSARAGGDGLRSVRDRNCWA